MRVDSFVTFEAAKWLAPLLFLAYVPLLSAGPDLPGEAKADALIIAVQTGIAKSVQHLLDTGSDPDVADELGHTPLHFAVRGTTVMVQMLLDAGADPNSRNAGGISPLMLAADAGRAEVIALLRKAGARVDVKDYQGSSAYDWALRGGHAALAARLKAEIEAAQRGMQLSGDGTVFDDAAYVTARYPEWFKDSFYDLPEDLAEARADGKQGIMLFISARQCSYCQAFLDTSMSDERLQKRLRTNFDVIGLDIFDDSEMVALDGEEYRVKEFVLHERASLTPSLMFFGEKGRLLAKVVGYFPPERFGLLLDYLEYRAYEEQHFREYLAERVKPAETGARIIRDRLFEGPPYMLDRRSGLSLQPLMVVFEQAGCEACERFHRRVMSDQSIRRLLKGFETVQLDVDEERRKLVTPDGTAITASNWYRELDLSYAPAILFFDKQGREVMRIDSEVLPFRMQGTLQMLLEGVSGEEAQLQRWRRGKVLQSLQKNGAF